MLKRLFVLVVTIFFVVSAPSHAYRLYIPEIDEHVNVYAMHDAQGDSPRISVRGNMGIESNEEERLESGFSFLASQRSTSVANGDTRTIFIDNPGNSPRNAVGMVIRANASAKMQLDIFEDVTLNDTGTLISAKNANVGADTSSVVNVSENGSYSNLGDAIFETIVPGGGTSGLQIGGESQASTLYIPPGHNILLQATNTSGGGEDLVLNIKWIEFK